MIWCDVISNYYHGKYMYKCKLSRLWSYTLLRTVYYLIQSDWFFHKQQKRLYVDYYPEKLFKFVRCQFNGTDLHSLLYDFWPYLYFFDRTSLPERPQNNTPWMSYCEISVSPVILKSCINRGLSLARRRPLPLNVKGFKDTLSLSVLYDKITGPFLHPVHSHEPFHS